jgi:hypothetical protein
VAYRLDLSICSVIVDDEQEYVETRFPDGTKVPATPNGTPEAAEMVSKLGYSDEWTMTVDHEICHCWFAYLEGHVSPALWHVAHQNSEVDEVIWAEEQEVLEHQKELSSQEKRPWDHLKRPFHWCQPS